MTGVVGLVDDAEQRASGRRQGALLGELVEQPVPPRAGAEPGPGSGIVDPVGADGHRPVAQPAHRMGVRRLLVFVAVQHGEDPVEQAAAGCRAHLLGRLAAGERGVEHAQSLEPRGESVRAQLVGVHAGDRDVEHVPAQRRVDELGPSREHEVGALDGQREGVDQALRRRPGQVPQFRSLDHAHLEPAALDEPEQREGVVVVPLEHVQQHGAVKGLRLREHRYGAAGEHVDHHGPGRRHLATGAHVRRQVRREADAVQQSVVVRALHLAFPPVGSGTLSGAAHGVSGARARASASSVTGPVLRKRSGRTRVRVARTTAVRPSISTLSCRPGWFAATSAL